MSFASHSLGELEQVKTWTNTHAIVRIFFTTYFNMSYKESTNFVPTPSMKSIKKVCSDLGINSVITQQQMLFFVISFGWSYGFVGSVFQGFGARGVPV